MNISKIDILVYPCWSGGSFVFQDGVVESTGIKVTNGRWASKNKRNMWFNYAKQVAEDTSRLMFIVHEANGRLETYLHDENDFLGKQLDIVRHALKTIGEKRCYFFEDVQIRSSGYGVTRDEIDLAEMVTNNGYRIPDPVENSVYGNHRGYCTLKIGQQVLDNLGLSKTEVTEDPIASVTDQLSVMKEAVRFANQNLYAEITRYDHVDVTTASSTDRDTMFYYGAIFDYLRLTHTILEVKHAASKVSSLEEFLNVLAPEIKGISGYELSKSICTLLESVSATVIDTGSDDAP